MYKLQEPCCSIRKIMQVEMLKHRAIRPQHTQHITAETREIGAWKTYVGNMSDISNCGNDRTDAHTNI
jgi:hypothetical protein